MNWNWVLTGENCIQQTFADDRSKERNLKIKVATQNFKLTLAVNGHFVEAVRPSNNRRLLCVTENGAVGID